MRPHQYWFYGLSVCLTQKRPNHLMCLRIITDSLICLSHACYHRFSDLSLCLTQKRPSQQRCARCVVTGRQASTMGWSAVTGVGDSSNVPFARNRSRCTCAKTTIPASSTSTAATSARPVASANVWPWRWIPTVSSWVQYQPLRWVLEYRTGLNCESLNPISTSAVSPWVQYPPQR